MKKYTKMDDTKLGAFLDAHIRNTIGFGDGDLIAAERKRNLEYYLNEKLGDEEEGRSQLQDSTTQDVVEAFLPGLLAPFISTDELCEFKPSEKTDVEETKLYTKYINHEIMVDNDGLSILYTLAKDGLISKNGFAFADWVEVDRTARSTARVDYFQLKTLSQDKTIEILKAIAFDANNQPIDPKLANEGQYDPQSVMFEVDFRRTWTEGRVKINNFPPEYAIVSSDAVTVETARLIGWQEQVTLSTLREEGFDEEKINQIRPSTTNGNDDRSGERAARTRAQNGVVSSTNYDEDESGATRLVWRTVLWTRVDYDGDGKAELRKIVRAGERNCGGVVLYNEEADFVPIVTFTPVPMPHQLFGRALVDLAISIQSMKTALLRSAMDATYDSTRPNFTGKISSFSEETMDDYCTRSYGSVIRVEEHDAFNRLNDAPDVLPTYQLLELADRMAEKRTPVTRQMQAVDPDILKNKTATGERIQQNAASQRQELVLRLFAESVAKLCKIVLKLTIKHQDKARMLRLSPQEEPIEIDPRFWDAEMDVSVKVGLGTGTKDQQMQNLMMINQIQMGDIQLGLPTVSPDKLYNTRARMVETAGLSTPETYFNDPKQAQGQQAPNPQQAQAAAAEQEAQQKAQQEQAKQIQEAIQQANEDGKKEGADFIKQMELASKERMHDKDTQIQVLQSQLKMQEIDSNREMKAADAALAQQAQQTQDAIKIAELNMRGEENQLQAQGYNV